MKKENLFTHIELTIDERFALMNRKISRLNRIIEETGETGRSVYNELRRTLDGDEGSIHVIMTSLIAEFERLIKFKSALLSVKDQVSCSSKIDSSNLEGLTDYGANDITVLSLLKKLENYSFAINTISENQKLISIDSNRSVSWITRIIERLTNTYVSREELEKTSEELDVLFSAIVDDVLHLIDAMEDSILTELEHGLLTTTNIFISIGKGAYDSDIHYIHSMYVPKLYRLIFEAYFSSTYDLLTLGTMSLLLSEGVGLIDSGDSDENIINFIGILQSFIDDRLKL